jgi:hypothetical protein
MGSAVGKLVRTLDASADPTKAVAIRAHSLHCGDECPSAGGGSSKLLDIVH